MASKETDGPRSKKMRQKVRYKAVKMYANSIDLLSSDDDADAAFLLLGLDTQASGDASETSNVNINNHDGDASMSNATDGGEKDATDGGEKDATDGGEKNATDGGEKDATDGGEEGNEGFAEPEESIFGGNDDDCENEDDNANDEDFDDFDIIPEQQPQANGDKPLYTGSLITVAESLLSILVFVSNHSITGAALADLLILISLHCLQPNLCVKTLYLFKKYFISGKAPLKLHYFCSICMKGKPSKDCLCENCQNSNTSYFIEIPFLAQIQDMFNRENFYEYLQFRFTRTKTHVDNIEDIYDGDVYRSHFGEGGFLRDPNNMSLMWYTDGLSLFKSSNFSIWPLYFAINELPFKKRMKQENMILAGLWFGGEKPEANTFMYPFHSVLREFRQNGSSMFVPSLNRQVTVRGMLLCGTCDLPAKSLFCNMTQFNGNYGCGRCKEKGKTHSISLKSNVHVYPYNRNTHLMLRTHKETVDLGKTATKTKPELGVKGPSVLSFIVPDIIKSTGVDIMHGMYLGVVRRLMHLWFDPCFHSYDFSLSKMVHVVDNLLLSIRPPSFVQRAPRSIKSHLNYWKASEFKSWFFYYSIPILTHINMDFRYLEHHILLVSALYILNRPSISLTQLTSCQKMIQKYVKEFQDLYGERFMTINVHQILHLTESVQNLGPLWVYSCFPFENLNGVLTKSVHGTRYTQLQICTSISIFLELPVKISKLNCQSVVKKFCETLNTEGRNVKTRESIGVRTYSLGTYMYVKFILNKVRLALYCEDINGGSHQYFKRIKKSGIIYTSESYTNEKKKHSYCAAFDSGGIQRVGLISQFVRWSNCICSKSCSCIPARYFAIINELRTGAPISPGLSPVISCNREISLAIDIEHIKSPCFLVTVKSKSYVGIPVNLLEME